MEYLRAADGGGDISYEWSSFLSVTIYNLLTLLKKDTYWRLKRELRNKEKESYTPANTIQGDNDCITGSLF